MRDPADRDIDHLFHDSLQLHENAPGEHVWHEIEKKLDFEDRALAARMNKRLMRTASIVLLCTVVLSSLIWDAVQKPVMKIGLSKKSPILDVFLRHQEAGNQVALMKPFSFPKFASNGLRRVLRQ